MSDSLHQIEYKGYTIFVKQDDSPMNPRTEWDNITKMCCFHKRYELGDKEPGFREDDFGSWEALEKAIILQEKPMAILPLYLMDHSGLTIKTSSFNDPWDSGRVGFVWITKKEYFNNWSAKDHRISKARLKRAYEILEQDVRVYNDYLTGSCYGYEVEDPEGEPIDSCWGYYLSEGEKYNDEKNEMFNNGRAAVDRDIERKHKKAKEESDRAQKEFETNFALVP